MINTMLFFTLKDKISAEVSDEESDKVQDERFTGNTDEKKVIMFIQRRNKNEERTDQSKGKIYI